MISVELAQVAEKAIIEKYSSQLSLINIIDRFHVATIPFVIPEMSFAMRTKREEGDTSTAEFKIIIKQQDDNIYLEHTGLVEYQDKLYNNLVIHLRGLVVQKISPLEIIVNHGGQLLSKLEIPVKQIGPIAEDASSKTN